MALTYDIVKIKGSKEYGICSASDPKQTPIPGVHGDKKKIIKRAADMNGMDSKTFLKERR